MSKVHDTDVEDETDNYETHVLVKFTVCCQIFQDIRCFKSGFSLINRSRNPTPSLIILSRHISRM